MGQSPSTRCKHHTTRLVRAVRNGDIRSLKKTLSKGVISINHVHDQRGCPLLCLAVRKEDIQVVSLLLSDGAPKTEDALKPKDGGCHVRIVGHCEQDILSKLYLNLELPASATDVDVPEHLFGDDVLAGQTCGNYAQKRNRVFCVQHHVNLDVTDKKGLSPVHISAINGATDIARVLVERGADVNKLDCLEASPLHAAAANSNVDMCQLLMDNYALANACEKSGLTPLHLAVMTGGVAVVRTLLRHGAWANVPDHEGRSPVHFAAVLSAFRGLDDVVRTNRSLVLNLLLLKHGGAITYQDDSKCSPLSYALIKDNMKLVRMYVDFGLRLEKADHDRMTQKHPEAAAKYEEELEDPDTRVPSLYRCCRRAVMGHLAESADTNSDSKLYSSVSQFELPTTVEDFLKYNA